jgi:hypothetical protein
MNKSHWIILGACLVSLGTMISGFHDWSEAVKPSTVGGALGIIGANLAALYTQKPQ